MPLFGLAVRIPVYPPSLIKTRLQTGAMPPMSLLTAGAHIARTEGPLALWRGFGVSLFGLAVGPVYVSALEASKAGLRALNRSAPVVCDDSPVIAMAAGAIGSVAGQTVAVPLDVVTQRLQLEMRRTARSGGGGQMLGALALARDLGPRGLYRGYAVSLAQYVPSSALTWGTYDSLSRHARARAARWAMGGRYARAADVAACAGSGALAGAFTGVVTCPLDVVRTRLQTATAADAAGGAAGIARAVWAAHGLAGFWAGVGARVATLSPLMAAILGGYEVLKRACAKDLSALDY
jgi:hypothetical protein